MVVIRKITNPRSCLFCKNCPSPGMIKEKNNLDEELVEDPNVFSEIVMKELFERQKEKNTLRIKDFD